MRKRDPALDTLPDLNGVTLVIDPEGGHWVRFVATDISPTAQKPHGLDDSLTLHGPDGERLVGFDNTQRVEKRKMGEPQTTAIEFGECGLMNTAMRQNCLPIFGCKWMPCFAGEE
ncbi:MAG TPA: hypothetical protein VJN94_05335 [Candidatus Binataceae bacterium]|nr:hypothetical protein [Candidatus Binataceae bacterium]